MSLSSIVRSIAFAREFFSATLETEARVWVHILKTVGAALIAMGLSMRLELSSPRTAMVTVFIVMQPQTGMVIAKSFYRFIGTIVGAMVTVGLTALFGQFPELFLLSITLWICLCTIGASLNRSFRAYGFVLSGYTTALIGIPALANPDGVFISAMTRLSELSMGIFCAATVSALIFPQHVADTLKEVVRTRFIRFSKLVGDVLGAQAVHGAPTELHALFAADVVGLEALSSVAVFEDFETKWRARRLSQLNTEFMNVTTRVRALHQWLLRLRATEGGVVVDLIESCLQEIPSLLVTAEGQPVRNAAEAKYAAEQLLAFNAALPSRLANTRSAIEESSLTMLPDFDISVELLERLVDEMHRYTEAYASLAEDAYDGPAATARFATKTNLLAASASGLRAAAALCLSAMIWYVTAWPSGAGAVVNTAVNSALTGTMPNPAMASRQMLWGTVTACVLAPAVLFFVYPLIDGYALLCAVLIPPLALGVYISTRPGGMGFGLGYCISFCLLAGPDNPMVYDVERTLNDALAGC
ncbi:fusaric acid resistance protein fusB, fusC, fusD [Burkholderia sp. SJ98]|nr:fusaric acid resistance protein fusB, fusC, fusD [Burkholderia sp. SJ98]